jgi:hypothetical protein
MKTDELLDLIENLNSEMYDILQYEEFCGFAFRSSGLCSAINFLSQPVWCSENDEREYDANYEDEREPMEGFLRRRANEEIAKISRLTF